MFEKLKNTLKKRTTASVKGKGYTKPMDFSSVILKLDEVKQAVREQEVNVQAPQVLVNNEAIIGELQRTVEAIQNIKVESPRVDVKSIVETDGIEHLVRDIEVAIVNNKALDAQSLRNILADSLSAIFGSNPKKYLPVRLTNGKEFYSALNSVVNAFSSSKEMHKKAIDEVSADLTYVGVARIGASDIAPVWKVKRISKSGTVTTIEWANRGEYTSVWADRATLTYE
jgi:hypothetical protein